TSALDASITDLTEQLRERPDDAAILHDLAVLHGQAGRITDAVDFARQSVALGPTEMEAWLNLGNLESRVQNLDQAVTALTQATEIAPDDSRGWFSLGNVLALNRQRRESIVALETARDIAPNSVDVLASLALAYRKQARLDDAIKTYQAAFDLNPSNARLHSNLLVALQYQPNTTPQSLFDNHQQWSARHGTTTVPLTVANDHDAPLRVGYVSGDFRAHPIGCFLTGVLSNHDRRAFTATCFSDTRTIDATTESLRKKSDTWLDTRGMSDDAFCELVRREEIDILIDLSGHFSHSRLTAFARKPAPVQASWAGYVGTTGLAAMDWLIADQHHTPDGYETYASELIVRLPHNYLCYAPPETAPDIASLPSLENNHFTFGCFNNFAKINDSVLSTWAEILSAVNDSRLILKTADLDQPDLCSYVVETMVKLGIDESRLDLRTASPQIELLATYNEVDIALDPFPYSGGLTTLEALWMGVPVITKTGQTFAGRHSTAHLSAVGLDDWIAESDSSYVRIATEKAIDRAALPNLRSTLRARMAASPLCNHLSFTRSLERAFQMMWADATTSGSGRDGARIVDISS
ncbi:MAG: tetratricopeptide repeat protein, partial [Rhodospirillaceae bacterium]|nr:tetratricopeptide repeat protein [Rhodospirillaceae bacterium]